MAELSLNQLQESLKKDYDVLLEFSSIVHACHRNFVWAEQNRSAELPLLDFDIICPTLPSFAEARQEPNNEEVSGLTGLGSRSVQLWTRNLDRFVIPPGAAAEILDRKQRIGGKLAEGGKKLFQKIDAILEQNAPIDSLLGGSTDGPRSFVEGLHKELTTMEGWIGDTTALDGILKRAISYEDLWGKREASDLIELTFNDAFEFLSRRRPQQSKRRSNLYDAWNVACTVQMYENARKHESAKEVPILLSHSTWITAYNTSRLREQTDKNEPAIFQNHKYLAVSQGIKERACGRIAIASDIADKLSVTLTKLMQAYRDVGTEISMSPLSFEARQVTPAAVVWTDVCPSKWRVLEHERRKLGRHFGWLLMPSHGAVEADRIDFANTMINDEVRRHLSSDRRTDIVAGLKKLRHRLANYRTDELSDWHELWLRRPAEIAAFDERSAVSIALAPNDGVPLSQIQEASCGQAFSESASAPQQRLVASLSGIPNSVFCALEPWTRLDGDGRWALTWRHRLDGLAIWAEASKILHSLTEQSTLTASLFPRRNEQLKTFSLEAAEQAYFIACGTSTSPSYFELRAADVTAFADVVPVEESEFQFGVVLPQALLQDPNKLKFIADSMRKSCFFSGKSKFYVKSLKAMLVHLRTMQKIEQIDDQEAHHNDSSP